MNLKQLKANRDAEFRAAEAILAKANSEALTAEERTQLEAHMAKVDEYDATIKTAERVAAAAPPAAPSPGLEAPRVPARVHNNQEDKPFENFGDFLRSVVNAGQPSAVLSDMDPRLHKYDVRSAEVRAATGMNETNLQDGGFLVSQDVATTLIDRTAAAGSIYPDCYQQPIGDKKNGIKLPYADETSRVDGSRSGGVQVYWPDEPGTVTPTKPKLGSMELNYKKAMALLYMTDDLLDDTVALGDWATRKYIEEMSYSIDNKILRGTGAGTLLGVLNSQALIPVAKETSQAAATLQYENIVKMYARMAPRSLMSAKWYINQDVFPQLALMTIKVKNVAGTENVGGSAAYLPPNGAANAPFGTLLGRPIVIIEQASTLGTVGDVLFADFQEYITIKKGLKVDSSIHVRFLYDESVFRFVQRIDGQPAWKTALTPANGTNTVSPFVALVTR